MKATTLRMLVGVTTPLILTGSVQAGYTGISTASKPNAFGLLTVNVYANFDRPGENHMIAVSGSPMNPLHIQVTGGTFYNHVFAGDQAPNCALACGIFPSIRFDTFVTIGKKTAAGDQLTITPGFPTGITGSSLWTDSSGWTVTPNNPQGNPFDAANSFPGNGQVLIGQFSTADGVAIQGTMLLAFFSNGVAVETVVSFFHVPTPGALAMMGVAGLIGKRRRRRHHRE